LSHHSATRCSANKRRADRKFEIRQNAAKRFVTGNVVFDIAFDRTIEAFTGNTGIARNYCAALLK
jgi:hypothetical protein